MQYTAEVSRANPSCLLFLIDQSGSMADPFGVGDGKKKADGVADAINRLLQNLIIKCAKAEGVRDYFYVGVIGYGEKVGPAFGGVLAGKELVPISEVAEKPTRVEERKKKEDDGAGGVIERTIKFPIWFEPVANAGTPMCQAFKEAYSIIQNWLTQNPNCFPPILINITDGESTDGDPNAASQAIRNLASKDGNVLLFNLHLSSSNATPTIFPSVSEGLADQYAKLLFDMSSVMPEYMRSLAEHEGYKVTETTRGFVFNADIVSVIRFLDIGTRPNNLR